MDDPKRILLIQLKRVGDVVVTTPIFPAIKTRFPKSELHVLTERPYAPLLQNNPYVDRIQIYDRRHVWQSIRKIRDQRYDWILDFQSSPRSVPVVLASGAVLTAGYRVPFWGRFYRKTVKRPAGESVVEGKYTLVDAVCGPVPHVLERQIFLTEAEREWADKTAAAFAGSRSVVGLVPTSLREARRWPGAYFAKVGSFLQSQGYAIWWFWGPGEDAYVKSLQEQTPGSALIPLTSLRQMAALLAKCRLLVTNTNGPMHMAVAVGTPTLTVYGPTNGTSWSPGGPRHRALEAKGLSCLGCNMSQCPFEHECMTWVTPEQMFAVATEMLSDLKAGVR